MNGDTALVGAPSDDTASGDSAGSAYAFVRSGVTWTEQAKLTAPDAGPDALFGDSLAVGEDSALVGAPGASSAYRFLRSGTAWTVQAQVTHPPGFPNSVAVDRATAVVGVVGGYAPGVPGVGAAYIYSFSPATAG